MRKQYYFILRDKNEPYDANASVVMNDGGYTLMPNQYLRVCDIELIAGTHIRDITKWSNGWE